MKGKDTDSGAARRSRGLRAAYLAGRLAGRFDLGPVGGQARPGAAPLDERRAEPARIGGDEWHH
ncbi:MAG: hypothetical protein ACOY93_15390 [Bacillota bacterium]